MAIVKFFLKIVKSILLIIINIKILILFLKEKIITIKIKKYFKKSINISFKTSVPATNNETCV